MALSKEARAKLPKAKLFDIGLKRRYPFFGKFRLANAVRLDIWWLTVHYRAPWLERSARALHPHLFPSSIAAAA